MLVHVFYVAKEGDSKPKLYMHTDTHIENAQVWKTTVCILTIHIHDDRNRNEVNAYIEKHKQRTHALAYTQSVILEYAQSALFYFIFFFLHIFQLLLYIWSLIVLCCGVL